MRVINPKSYIKYSIEKYFKSNSRTNYLEIMEFITNDLQKIDPSIKWISSYNHSIFVHYSIWYINGKNEHWYDEKTIIAMENWGL